MLYDVWGDDGDESFDRRKRKSEKVKREKERERGEEKQKMCPLKGALLLVNVNESEIL